MSQISWMRGVGFYRNVRALCVTSLSLYRGFNWLKPQGALPSLQHGRTRLASRTFGLSSASFLGTSGPRARQDNGWAMAEQRYCVEYAKRGTAGCKKCKDKIVKGLVRVGKIVPNPFSESAGEMKEWYHVKCIFEKLERARATTKKIEDITDLEGWEELQDEDKDLINKHVSGKYWVWTRLNGIEGSETHS